MSAMLTISHHKGFVTSQSSDVQECERSEFVGNAFAFARGIQQAFSSPTTQIPLQFPEILFIGVYAQDLEVLTIKLLPSIPQLKI